jgi:hypothetical protein
MSSRLLRTFETVVIDTPRSWAIRFIAVVGAMRLLSPETGEERQARAVAGAAFHAGPFGYWYAVRDAALISLL